MLVPQFSIKMQFLVPERSRHDEEDFGLAQSLFSHSPCIFHNRSRVFKIRERSRLSFSRLVVFPLAKKAQNAVECVAVD